MGVPVFSDGDAREFVQSEFPEYLALYIWYPRPVLKADLFRLLAVYRLGGFYLDTDFLLHKKLDPLCREKAVFAYEHEIDQRNYNLRYPPWLRAGEERLTLANYAFGAEAGHPFLGGILDELVYQTQTFEVEDCVDLDILQATGPDAVKSVYYRNREPKNEFSEKKNSPSARPCRRRRRNRRNSSKNPVEKPIKNSSDTSPNPSAGSNALTRRNFMKKSALTAGAVTLLGQGIGLATEQGGGSCRKIVKWKRVWNVASDETLVGGVGSDPNEQIAYVLAVQELRDKLEADANLTRTLIESESKNQHVACNWLLKAHETTNDGDPVGSKGVAIDVFDINWVAAEGVFLCAVVGHIPATATKVTINWHWGPA